MGVTAAHRRDCCSSRSPWANSYFCMKQHLWLPCCCFGQLGHTSAGCVLPVRGRRLLPAAGGKGWSGLGAVCLLETSSADGVPGGRCCLDTDQMALGADELLAGALQLLELPPPSPAFLAAGSGGRGINLLLALPCMGVAEAPCAAQPVPHRGAGGMLEVLSPLWGPPHLPHCFPGGFLAVPECESRFPRVLALCRQRGSARAGWYCSALAVLCFPLWLTAAQWEGGKGQAQQPGCGGG